MQLNPVRGSRVSIRLLTASDAKALWSYTVRNRTFFQPFQPLRGEGEYTLARQQEKLQAAEIQASQDAAYLFGIFTIESDMLIGHIQLSGIIRGPFQNAYLGYAMDQEYNGRGLMTEALHLCMTLAFGPLSLHRVQAAVMPRNAPSIRVLEKVGFVREGYSRRYLKINGEWEDHVIYALLREDYQNTI